LLPPPPMSEPVLDVADGRLIAEAGGCVGGPDMAVEAGALGEGAAAGGAAVQLQVLMHRPAGRGAGSSTRIFGEKKNRKISVTNNPTFHPDVDPDDNNFKKKAKTLEKVLK
jgi:hypothetical protein